MVVGGATAAAVAIGAAGASQATDSRAVPLQPISSTSVPDHVPGHPEHENLLGLKQKQAKKLQSRVEAYIAKTGGVQVSQYEVHFAGGDVSMSFPAKKHGQTPAMSRAAAVAAGLPADSLDAFPQGVGSVSIGDLGGSTLSCPYSKPFPVTKYYCFYQDINFDGRMLKFKDKNCPYVNFATYGFRNETSSWVNHSTYTIKVFNSVPPKQGKRLWVEKPTTDNAWVGTAKSDKADTFKPAQCPSA